MKVTELALPGLLLVEPSVFEDPRGYFFESYNSLRMKDAGVDVHFVQDNESMSSYGVVRGLHYQLAPYAQSKLVRAIAGSVFDVVLDLRRESPTFGQWYGTELTGKNKKQLYIPKGFAHGFSVLSPTAIFAYKCDDYYNRAYERAIFMNDPLLNIEWQIPVDKQVISDKDRHAPLFADAEFNF